MIYRLMLSLLLLSCGEGWAAPVESIGGNWTVSTLPPPCYKRMKEAMKSAEQHKFWPFLDIGVSDDIIPAAYPKECDEVCRRTVDLDAAVERKKKRDERLAAKTRWDAVMKECVK